MSIRVAGMLLDGATVIGVPPHGVVHLPFGDDPTVFYGRNGAGKTRLIDAVLRALRCLPIADGRVLLHGRADPTVSIEYETSFSEVLGDALSVSAQMYPDLTGYEGPSPVSDYLYDYAKAHLYLRRAFSDQPFWEVLGEQLEHFGPNDQLPVVIEVGGRGARLYLAGEVPEGSSMRRMLARDIDPLSNTDGGGTSLLDGQDFMVEGVELWMDEVSLLLEDSSSVAVEASWPAWASWPAFKLARIDRPLVTGLTVNAESEWPDVDSDTAKFVASRSAKTGMLEIAGGNQFEFNPVLRGAVADLETDVNALYRAVLDNPPRLSYNLRTPDEWFAGIKPGWEAFHVHGHIPIEELSWAEGRWATFSIATALAEHLRGPAVAFIDEPERGLHRRAESRVPTFLRELARRGLFTMAATHSPGSLNDPTLQIRHVQRFDAGELARVREWRPMGSSNVDRDIALDALGMTASDLYQLTRLFVFVEGEHDRIVVEGLLGRTLAEEFARCVPLRGAKNLKHLAAVHLLFDMTDANILVVLDNASEAADLWQQVVAANRAGDFRKRDGLLGGLRRLPGGEPQWLAEFASLAAERGRLDRIDVFGLGQPDVICYLPVAAFAPSESEDWPRLVALWRSEETGYGRRDLKTWLTDTRGAKFTVREIERAVEAAANDPLPVELEQLGFRVRERSAFSR